MWALKRTNLDALVLETKNIRFFWRLNFPARDFPPLNGDFWNLLQKIDILPFWDCLTSILEVKKTEWMILRQRNASSNVTSAWGVWLAQTDIYLRDRYGFSELLSSISHLPVCVCNYEIPSQMEVTPPNKLLTLHAVHWLYSSHFTLLTSCLQCFHCIQSFHSLRCIGLHCLYRYVAVARKPIIWLNNTDLFSTLLKNRRYLMNP